MIVFVPSLSAEHALAAGDWTDLLYPFYRYAAHIMTTEGRLPFWNPLIFSGLPHLSSLNSTALYPTELAGLAAAIPVWRFYALDMLLHLWLAGCGMTWWLRRDGASPGAALFGGLAYMLGGHLLTLAGAGHAHWVRAMAWLPLAFPLIEDRRPAGQVRRAAMGGATVGLAILTNALQFAAYALPVLLIWILLDRGRTFRWRAARGAALLAAAAGLGAVIWVPGMEYFLLSVRAAPEAGLSARWAMSAWDLLDWVIPGCWGDSQEYLGPHQFRSSSDYPGVLTLLFAAAGAVSAWRTERRWIALGLIAGLLAFGPATPLGRALAALPVFSGFRTSLRWISFTHLALAVLAARGWDHLACSVRARLVAGGAVVALAIGCAVLGSRTPFLAARAAALPFVIEHLRSGTLEPAGPERIMGKALRQSLARGVGAAGAILAMGTVMAPAVFVIEAADLLFAGQPYFIRASIEQQEHDEPGRELARRMSGPVRVASDEYFGIPNRRMALGLASTWGYHGLPGRDYVDLWTWCLASGSVEVMAILNVGYLVTAGTAPAGWRTLAHLTGGEGEPVTVAENPVPPLHAWLAGDLIPVSSPAEGLTIMRRTGWTMASVPIEGIVDVVGARARSGSLSAVWGREEIQARVGLAAPGVLVLSETWFPAWRAMLDGRRVPILRAYSALRAIAVPAGMHDVTMRYESWLFKIGLWLTLGTIACLVGCGAPVRFRKESGTG